MGPGGQRGRRARGRGRAGERAAADGLAERLASGSRCQSLRGEASREQEGACGLRAGKGGSGSGLGQGGVRKLLGPRGRNWAAGREVGRGFGLLGWAGVFLFYFYFFSLFLFQTTPKLI